MVQFHATIEQGTNHARRTHRLSRPGRASRARFGLRRHMGARRPSAGRAAAPGPGTDECIAMGGEPVAAVGLAFVADLGRIERRLAGAFYDLPRVATDARVQPPAIRLSPGDAYRLF